MALTGLDVMRIASARFAFLVFLFGVTGELGPVQASAGGKTASVILEGVGGLLDSRGGDDEIDTKTGEEGVFEHDVT